MSPGLLEPGVHQLVARRFHLLLAGHTGASYVQHVDADAVVVTTVMWSRCGMR